MKRFFVLVVAVVMTGTVGLALAQEQPEQQPADPTVVPPDEQTPATPSEEDLSPEERERRARVVAKVGDVEITVGDVEDQINQQSPFLRARYRDPAKLREFVGNMVRFELLAAEAQKQGYDDNEVVERTVKQNAVQHLIRREFDQRITPESIPEADVREYYDTHESEFHRPAMVRASHILVADRERANALIEELKDADARAFRQAAREHSIDTETKLRGGDLRYFTEEGTAPTSRDSEIAEPIVEAAFGLDEVGDMVSQPVQVGDHWSIVKLTGKRPAEHRAFEESEQGIRLRLWRQRRQDGIEQFVTELRERYQPEVHEERMRPIQLDTTPETPTDPHGAAAEEGEAAEGEAPAATE